MNIREIVALTGIVLVGFSTWTAAAEPQYPEKTEKTEDISFLEQLKRDVPPLKNQRGDRWPMICWEAIGFESREPDVYRTLLERGLTQHIRMDAKMIPTAKALQKAGSPVIMMQGMSGPYPYNRSGDWRHHFEEGYKPRVAEHWYPSWEACPAVFAGWQENAKSIRETLGKFKDAGVTVDAVWMDWETEPKSSAGKGGWENARHCTRCRKTVPKAVLNDYDLWPAYCRRLHGELIGSYLAAPVRDVFPACSVTNWLEVYSTRERTALGWVNNEIAPTVPSMITASNPVAYGNTTFWRFWEENWPLDARHVDIFYTHLMLRQVSDDAANKAIYAPQKDCFPWVARWCPDVADPDIPLLSREAYRECLRHIWLRGADSLQIFQPRRKGYPDIVFSEVEDAVAVYDEMLPYARFLDAGEIMCFDTPGIQHEGVIWSGLRLEKEAVVRTISQGEQAATVEIEPWEGLTVELDAPVEGATYLLERQKDRAQVVKQ